MTLQVTQCSTADVWHGSARQQLLLLSPMLGMYQLASKILMSGWPNLQWAIAAAVGYCSTNSSCCT
jgi:hypothetical protein